MLVTNVGGLSEIIADKVAGYVVEPTSERIAEAIVDFYENSRATAFTAEMQKLKQKFSWTNLTQNIFSIYEELQKV